MSRLFLSTLLVLVAVAVSACGGGGGTTQDAALATAPDVSPNAATAAFSAPIDSHLTVAAGLRADIVGTVAQARELAAAPNGDLLVGTLGSTVAVIPDADGDGAPGAVRTLATLPQGPAAGIALGGDGYLYVGTNTAVWRLPYTPGAASAGTPVQIAAVRTGPVAPNSDGDVHTTTSVAVSGGRVFVGVGSSCNACNEVDPTRAAVSIVPTGGGRVTPYATHLRNAIALAVAPDGTVWGGGAGQDALPFGHPYEFFDSISNRPAGISYGWPACDENHVAYAPGTDCSAVAVPHIVLPAYSTIIGAAFYPTAPSGKYALGAAYRGGLFLAAHGSWHTAGGTAAALPQVVFVAMSGSVPQTAVNWSNPAAQYTPIVTGYLIGGTQYRGRPTGIAVGPDGSVFFADDATGTIIRLRPA